MKSSRMILVGGITCATVLAAGAATAAASSPAAVHKGTFVGSIPRAGLTDSQRLSLVKVTPAQADATAVSSVPGTAGTPQLISDYGFLVYRTIVTSADGTRTEVIVDAGDGTVLDHYSPFWNGVIGPGDNDLFGIAATTTTSVSTVNATETTTPVTSSGATFVGTIAGNGSTGAALRAMATQSPAQANAGAVAAVPGTAGTPELIWDHGYVVYRTIVTASDGTKTEVIVDAGNGAVLARYAPVWDGVIGDTDTTTGVAATASAPFVGSIPEDGRTNAQLDTLVKVTATEANAAAVAAEPGTAGTPELIHDYGYVVYRTIVTAIDGTKTEVVVDAGTGAVLDHYAPVWNGVPGSDGH